MNLSGSIAQIWQMYSWGVRPPMAFNQRASLYVAGLSEVGAQLVVTVVKVPYDRKILIVRFIF